MQIYPFFVALFLLERLRPFRGERLPVFRREVALDAIYFVQSNLARHGIFFLARVLVLWAGWTWRERAHVPWAAGMLAGCLVPDFTFYLVHRWYHRPGLPWRTHLCHHSIQVFDSLASFRLHVLEQAAYTALYVASFLLFTAGFGWPALPFVAGSVINTVWGMFTHSNIRIDPTKLPARLLFAVFISPEAHRLHHTDFTINKNYGNTVTFWDRLFGTYLAPRGLVLGEIGSLREPKLRGSYRFHFFHPFFPRSSRREA